jgi:hypothetical protein
MTIDKLPSEVLIKIFKYLHLKQKLRCMLVCQKWARVLVSGKHILETVTMLSLPSSESLQRRVNELIKRASEGEKTAANTCQRLLYENKSGGICFDTVSLAQVFPNLKFAFFESERGVTFEQDDSMVFTTKESESFQGWRNGLEIVVDWSHNGFFFLSVLDTGVFHRLTSLALRFSNFNLSNVSIFKRLKHAPFLTALVVSILRLSATDLEELHDNTPRLTSLSLQGLLIFNSDQVKSLNIAPMKQIKALKILALSRFSDVNGFMLYMEELELFPPGRMYALTRATGAEHNSSAWSELVSVIGPSLRTCTIGFEDSIDNMIGTLLQHACNLERLNLKPYKYSALCKYNLALSSFQCLHTLSLFQISSVAKLARLKELRGLRDLTLQYDENLNGDPVCVDSLINVLSANIESLRLTGTVLTIHEKVEAVDQQSNIVHLKLSRVTMDKYVVDFIEQNFQSMETLGLNLCQGINKLDLSNHRLSCVEILPFSQASSVGGSGDLEALKVSMTKTNTHLQLTSSNQTCYYTMRILDGCTLKPLDAPFLDVYDHAIQHALEPSLFNQEWKYFQFNCASVHSFYFCGYLIL